MEDDFLFEQQDYGYEQDYMPPPPWWSLRARWASISDGYRVNVALYALGAMSLALLVFELTTGENNPNLEVASRVIPVVSSTTTSQPARLTTTSRPSSTTSTTVKGTSTTVKSTTGTTRRPAASTGPAAPAASEDPVPAEPGPTPTNPQQTTTAPPTTPQTSAPNTTRPPTTSPATTQPPDTQPQPGVTLSPRACELLLQHGHTGPGC